MPIIKRKNINRARDIETFQNRSRTSTTVVFWVMNTTKRLTKIIININLSFKFFTFALMPGNRRESASSQRLQAYLFLPECHPE